jgi:translin
MDNLNQIAERVHQVFELRTRARDKALGQARQLTRFAAHTIRAVHRNEVDLAAENLAQARTLVEALKLDLAGFPDLYFAGYTQDAIKEYAEASITSALVQNQPLPTPEELGLEHATFINGLAEVPGELRRRCLDILRQGYSQEAERLLSCMDDIYDLLVTLDYPDAITNGLRRQTDLVRGILERTRGDLTISQREQQLQLALEKTQAQLSRPPETK